MGRKKVTKYTFDSQIPIEEKLKRVFVNFELDRASQLLLEINKIALKEKLSYFEFLDRLFDEESYAREDSRLERWTKQARFPWSKSISEYDFNYPKHIDKEIILDLMKCDWIKSGGNIVFFGASGVGKTHLSIALGLEAISQGYETRFIAARQLVEMINTAIDKDGGKGGGENRKKLLNMFMNVPLLILDDLAYSSIEPPSTDFLFQLIVGRYDARRSTILTGNEGFESWEKNLFSGNKAKAMAAADRFLEDCVVINIKGDSYRSNSAIKKKIEDNPPIIKA